MKQVNIVLLAICLFSAFLGSLSSCRQDILIDTPEISLSFSMDTLRFDTVFTEVGTVTRFFKIQNEELEAVILDEVTLQNQNGGFFRINADGVSGDKITDLRIEGRDSIYVFVEATIDPDQDISASPFVIEDKISIKANESNYEVHLEAWGQNANYIPSRFSAAEINVASCNGSIVWNDTKPYVIYGVLAIDQCDLIIEAGTDIYIHGGIAINENGVYNDGLLVITASSSLQINGTPEEPVTIRSDRLEESFADVPGQWGGILLQAGSRNNRITNAIIQHSIVGLSVDSSASLEIKNTEISFTSGSGLVASHAFITCENSLFHSNSSNGISLNYGGVYDFSHCTVANYDNQASALSANNIRCTDPLCQGEILSFPLNAKFSNCIFTGNEEDEINLLDISNGEVPALFDYNFNNCLVTVDELLDDESFSDFFDKCTSCLSVTRNDTLFLDLEAYDLHLDTLSLAIDFGDYIQGIDTDLEGAPREIDAVDAGCYEFQK